MPHSFEINKIIHSSSYEERKKELYEFLKYYFFNGRPKNFEIYIEQLSDCLPELMEKMSFDEMFEIIPAFYQFYYTITLEK